MLAPEVWAFNPPSSALRVSEESLESGDKAETLIRSHHLNHLVRLSAIPACEVARRLLDSFQLEGTASSP